MVDKNLGYTYLGWMNGWQGVPLLVVRCRELKHETIDVDYGPPNRGLDHEVRCDQCKYYYNYDSSD